MPFKLKNCCMSVNTLYGVSLNLKRKIALVLLLLDVLLRVCCTFSCWFTFDEDLFVLSCLWYPFLLLCSGFKVNPRAGCRRGAMAS